MADDPLFFLSYSRRDATGGHLDRFFDDLCEELAVQTGQPAERVGFRDDRSMPLGARWKAGLGEALARCRTFVPVYSPAYFDSPNCGREWWAFEARLEADAGGGRPAEVILPVLWARPHPRWLSGRAREVGYDRAGLPAAYQEEGLRSLLRFPNDEREAAYRQFLEVYSRWLLEAVEEHRVAPWSEQPTWEDLLNAFDDDEEDGPDPRLPQEARRYLRRLVDDLDPLPMAQIAEEGGEQSRLGLSDVFIDLDVGATVAASRRGDFRLHLGSGEGSGEHLPGKRGEAPPAVVDLLAGVEEADLERLARRVVAEAERAGEGKTPPGEETDLGGPRPSDGVSRPLRAVEAAALVPRLVMIGPPGGGKSAFARQLALALAGEILRDDRAGLDRLEGPTPGGEPPSAEDRIWPWGALFPVFVELRHLVESDEFPPAGERARAEHLLDYLERHAGLGSEGRAWLETRLERDSPSVLVLLDGLDEVPASDRRRERIRQLVASLAGHGAACRILLTSRPYAYQPESRWRLDGEGFVDLELAPFDDDAIRAFAHRWFAAQVARRQLSREVADKRRELLLSVAGQERLKPLAEVPLMLTMLADLAASGGASYLHDRAELYERSARLLLDRWNGQRGAEGLATLSDQLGMDVPAVRRALEAVAEEVHGEAEPNGEAVIRPGRVWEALRAESEDQEADRDRIVDLLHLRSGILVGDHHQGLRFTHRSYQEYLAACRLSEVGFPDDLGRRVRQDDPERWREVFLFAAARRIKDPYAFWALCRAVLHEEPPEPPADPADPGFLRAHLVALALRETGLHERIGPADRADLERYRLWLQRTLKAGALAPPERAVSGRILNLLGQGDTRPGVGLDDGMPAIEWVELPAGRFPMGTREDEGDGFSSERPPHEVDLPAFRISRYPVTWGQFRAFASDGGYDLESSADLWTGAGKRWLREENIVSPPGPPSFWTADNQPVVGVSWFEAMAFCRWLSEKCGMEIRLPTEREWERAARGEDGRKFPWGDDWRAGLCNSREAGIGSPSPVGMFPGGVSPEQVHDLAGNVWEWCLTKWRADYSEPPDDDEEGGAVRVLRGGAFGYPRHFVRGAFRFRIVPSIRDRDLGFRVVSPSS